MSDTPVTALVLGVGGNVSQGILKALALGALRYRVIGACVSPLSLGLYTTDRAYVSPQASDPTFIPWLMEICRKERVQVVLSGVEPVLAALAPHAAAIERETGARCIVSSPDCLAIGDDKLTTSRWLEVQDCHFPHSAASEDRAAVAALVAACGYPLIAKPRAGKGRHGFLTLRNDDDCAYATRQHGYVVQEYLGDDESEYTVGCFSDRDGVVHGTIAMRRELQEGTTYRAEVGAYPAVRAEAARIVAALKPVGPSNVQMRVANGRPVCFEINIRFSGTTPLRARFGWNDVEATVRHYALGEPAADLPDITSGVALRYWNEMYVAPDAVATLRATDVLDDPHRFPLAVETYGVRE